ncbi:hypothetical protein RhiirA1_393713 [Rhizophagus irregularis]|uniref:Protein kinase domain-containing protein n=1 Tax=Rhizophagus irregularis TaxID=588596 RepID=A0A2N0RVX5_9GLOM|nr:hypothetical protein RhiirA1_393713 [Rhizophagus irregularis]
MCDKTKRSGVELTKKLLFKDYRHYDHQDFKILSEIGTGGSAAVYVAYWKNTTSKFAIKKITKLSARKEIINEIDIIKKVDFHPNIIKFIGIIKKNENEKIKIVAELKSEEIKDDFSDCHLSNY